MIYGEVACGFEPSTVRAEVKGPTAEAESSHSRSSKVDLKSSKSRVRHFDLDFESRLLTKPYCGKLRSNLFVRTPQDSA